AVMVSENFNIEAPNYLSKESEVLLYARQDSQCIDCFQAFLPVHYRYHRPHIKDGETFIVVHNPDLLMYCDQEFPVLKCWAQSKVTAPCALNSIQEFDSTSSSGTDHTYLFSMFCDSAHYHPVFYFDP
ncbi:hypothetical protein Celaphus_00012640, partial [Cervus elaphus hippelaphus]